MRASEVENAELGEGEGGYSAKCEGAGWDELHATWLKDAFRRLRRRCGPQSHQYGPKSSITLLRHPSPADHPSLRPPLGSSSSSTFSVPSTAPTFARGSKVESSRRRRRRSCEARGVQCWQGHQGVLSQPAITLYIHARPEVQPPQLHLEPRKPDDARSLRSRRRPGDSYQLRHSFLPLHQSQLLE